MGLVALVGVGPLRFPMKKKWHLDLPLHQGIVTTRIILVSVDLSRESWTKPLFIYHWHPGWGPRSNAGPPTSPWRHTSADFRLPSLCAWTPACNKLLGLLSKVMAAPRSRAVAHRCPTAVFLLREKARGFNVEVTLGWKGLPWDPKCIVIIYQKNGMTLTFVPWIKTSTFLAIQKM